MGKLTAVQLKIFRNFNWLFGAYVYRFAIGFITLGYVTRYLGPEQYGMYAYSLSAFAFVELFMQLLNQEVFKKKVLEHENNDSLLKTVIVFQFLICLLLLTLFHSLLWGLEIETGERRVLMGIFSIGLIFRPIDTLSIYFSSQMRNDLISRSEIGVVTIFNTSRVFLVLANAKLFGFGWALAFQKLINFLFIGYYYSKTYTLNFLKSKVDFKLIKPIFQASLPLFIATTATVIFTRIDQVMLGNMLSDKSVGIYSVVVKLSEPWIFVAAILTQSVYPNLVKAFSKSRNEFYVKIHKTLCLLIYTALGVIIGTLIFGDFVVNLVFSDKYAASVPILKVHIIYVIFVFWTHLTNQYDVIVGATKITLIKTVVASLINIVLNYIFIQEIGIVGASYATICSYMMSSFLLNAFFKKTRPLFLMQLKSLAFWKFKWVYIK